MGNLVVRSIHGSVKCLLERDEQEGRLVLADEIRINRMQIDLDDFVVTLMARNQPVARDMRLLISVLKINSDLERMGDLAVNIAQRSLTLLPEPMPEDTSSLSKMAAVTEEMVSGALDAFLTKNASLAFALLKHDDEVDRLRDSIYEGLICALRAGSPAINLSLGLMSVARNLERIADHATNVAEDVIFVVQGADVRHHRETGVDAG